MGKPVDGLVANAIFIRDNEIIRPLRRVARTGLILLVMGAGKKVLYKLWGDGLPECLWHTSPTNQ